MSLQGTDLVAFTDESGTCRIARVPSGPAVLEVFFTGLDPQQVRLEVTAGSTVRRDVELTSAARYGAGTGTVKLDAFTVSSVRETDTEAIAINEQRFAANIKNVVAADALGDVMDGNVGEFLKFMPGITGEYDLESGGAVASISVRGFPTSMAVVSSDGAQMANTGNPQGNSRVFQFSQVSINNISRLEVTKVPTPSTAADSMAGSVNMVTKSAFERKDAQLRYSVSLSANSMNRYVHQVPVRKVYNATAAGTGATFARPYLQTHQFVSASRINARNSVGLRTDWRVAPHSVISFNIEAGRFESDRTSVDYTFNVGTNATPTPATGTRMTFGEDFTFGATGRGSVVSMGTASVFQTLDTLAGGLRYRFDNGDWRVEAGFGRSTSDGGYHDTAHGRFRQLGISLPAARVNFANVNTIKPDTIWSAYQANPNLFGQTPAPRPVARILYRPGRALQRGRVPQGHHGLLRAGGPAGDGGRCAGTRTGSPLRGLADHDAVPPARRFPRDRRGVQRPAFAAAAGRMGPAFAGLRQWHQARAGGRRRRELHRLHSRKRELGSEPALEAFRGGAQLELPRQTAARRPARGQWVRVHPRAHHPRYQRRLPAHKTALTLRQRPERVQ